MTPPPTMTTSAFSTHLVRAGFARALHHAPHLEDQLQRGEGGDVPVVKGRRDLNHVEADQARPLRRAAQQLQRLAARQAARGWNLSARRVGGIESVDVKRDVYLVAGPTVRRPSPPPRQVAGGPARPPPPHPPPGG